MGKYDALAELLLEVIKDGGYLAKGANSIPVGISNRHIHLSQTDLDTLFGAGCQLTKQKDLSQPMQFAAKETLTIAGPKGAIENVRVLGPVRDKSQVEILHADCYKLGIAAPVRLSGDLEGTPGITLIGPKGSVFLPRGLLVAMRHIHMNPEDAESFGVADGELVTIQIDGVRGGAYSSVAIRVSRNSNLEFHIDTEEANAMHLASTSTITINK